jgi:leucyl-tRNA synthetase
MSDTAANFPYDHNAIESKWQSYWLSHKTFKTNDDFGKPKYYVLDMFPYPSGAGLHVGHPEGYTATDIIARYKRMRGFNVLHPMGWDAFGLPAEQYAVKTGTHPRQTTDANIQTFRKQIQALGLSYDWDREIDTTAVDYYRWTQWIFLKLYQRGLAYESFAAVNWCPALGTVLANEEVIDGKSEVGDHPVVKKPMRQWVLKITEYAERLLADLEELDWPESIKQQQRNWIGRSEGCDLDFAIAGSSQKIRVFTTRVDTIFGVSFLVLAPEHPLVAEIVTPAQRDEVAEYVKRSSSRSDRERQIDTSKTGVHTGAFAVHPLSGASLPIFISDYVLMNYGHGAVMAVPGHDERDHEFAKKFDLAIVEVVRGPASSGVEEAAYAGDGVMVNSDFLDGLTNSEAADVAKKRIRDAGIGETRVTYKLRDWLFSRQRYWGEPIPVIHDASGKPIALSEDELPVLLPELDDFKPAETGDSPLARAVEWRKVERDGKHFLRETNTMPQWAGSCWYYLRFIDPRNTQQAWDSAKEKHWMPVDLYVGGAEHAVLHLLYARFWHKVLYDLGLVSCKEPFRKLVNQGMILGENGEKMSKSRGNVINPDDVIREWGADSMRLYEMFMGPLTATKPWQTNGIAGVNRFLKRVWRLVVDEQTGQISPKVLAKDSEAFEKLRHRTIKKVGGDIENLDFNTAISAMMELVNQAYKEESISEASVKDLVLILAPFAPHLCEDLWSRLGGVSSLAYEPWPSFDARFLAEDSVTLSVQVNGKLRGTITVPKDVDQATAIKEAKLIDAVVRQLQTGTIRKEIFVPGKIINFVVS